MSQRGKPVDSKIFCPWCGADYNHLTHNGSYLRDKVPVLKYRCKTCGRGFSSSIIRIKISKPSYDVEIGHKIKIEIKIFAQRGLGIKKIICTIQNEKDNNFAVYPELKREAEDIYKGVWDINKAVPGRSMVKIIVQDVRGGVAAQTKPIDVWQHYDVLIRKISEKYAIDPFLVKGLIWKESSFRPKTKSPKNAVGLMQLNEITIKDIKLEDNFMVNNPENPEQNITGGGVVSSSYDKKIWQS